jgi:heme oxygenase
MVNQIETSVRARLKNETRFWHDEVERELDLMDPQLSLESYQRVLKKFFGFYAPVEALTAAVCRDLPEALEQREKTPKLRADLAFFGIHAEGLPRCLRLPQFSSVADALGGCYVMEGATLGGQYISRHVRATLGIDAASGGSFFQGYGTETGRMWKSFEELLHRYADDDQAESTVAAAKATFEAFAVWLREAG